VINEVYFFNFYTRFNFFVNLSRAYDQNPRMNVQSTVVHPVYNERPSAAGARQEPVSTPRVGSRDPEPSPVGCRRNSEPTPGGRRCSRPAVSPVPLQNPQPSTHYDYSPYLSPVTETSNYSIEFSRTVSSFGTERQYAAIRVATNTSSGKRSAVTDQTNWSNPVGLESQFNYRRTPRRSFCPTTSDVSFPEPSHLGDNKVLRESTPSHYMDSADSYQLFDNFSENTAINQSGHSSHNKSPSISQSGRLSHNKSPSISKSSRLSHNKSPCISQSDSLSHNEFHNLFKTPRCLNPSNTEYPHNINNRVTTPAIFPCRSAEYSVSSSTTLRQFNAGGTQTNDSRGTKSNDSFIFSTPLAGSTPRKLPIDLTCALVNNQVPIRNFPTGYMVSGVARRETFLESPNSRVKFSVKRSRTSERNVQEWAARKRRCLDYATFQLRKYHKVTSIKSLTSNLVYLSAGFVFFPVLLRIIHGLRLHLYSLC